MPYYLNKNTSTSYLHFILDQSVQLALMIFVDYFKEGFNIRD